MLKMGLYLSPMGFKPSGLKFGFKPMGVNSRLQKGVIGYFLLPSVEVKTKYLFPLFSLIYPSTLPIIRNEGFTLLIFSKSSVVLL